MFDHNKNVRSKSTFSAIIKILDKIRIFNKNQYFQLFPRIKIFKISQNTYFIFDKFSTFLTKKIFWRK